MVVISLREPTALCAIRITALFLDGHANKITKRAGENPSPSIIQLSVVENRLLNLPGIILWLRFSSSKHVTTKSHEGENSIKDSMIISIKMLYKNLLKSFHY